jgi:hypothetical protein
MLDTVHRTPAIRGRLKPDAPWSLLIPGSGYLPGAIQYDTSTFYIVGVRAALCPRARLVHVIQVTRVAASLVVAPGVQVVGGRAFDVAVLESLLAWLAQMKANTALCSVLVGVLLSTEQFWLETVRPP